jgi:arylsulfatase A-like enzyme
MTTRRSFLKLTGLSLAGGLTAIAIPECAKKQRPNFLFILVDDLGWTDLSCYGSSFYETPNIDRLAAEGMKFTQAYAACPVCSPTRASIMTGKYPARMSTTDWFGAPQPETAHKHWTRHKPLLPASYEEKMLLDEHTMAEAFHDAGYRTFFAGKWHLGPEGFWPEDQGFDHNKGGFSKGAPYGPGRYFTPYGNPRLKDGPKGEHLPDRLATETIKFMSEEKSPFLAYLSFYSVHTPLMTTPELKKKYEDKAVEQNVVEEKWGVEGERKVRQVQNHAIYSGMIETMDDAVGRVLDALEKQGVAHNTVVIFMSDNGGLSTSEGHPTSNLPLRGGKGLLYEGGIREPMIIKWPNAVKPNSKCDVPVISTDFYPTILDMAGLAPIKEQHIDGVSLTNLLQSKQAAERSLFWHYPHYGNQGGTPGAAVRLGDWKLIEFFEDRPVELYNISEDIGELENRAESHPARVKELLALLQGWQKDVGAQFPTPNPNAAK